VLTQVWNSHQAVKDKEPGIDFNFFPGRLAKLTGNQYLVGGMHGGLYIFDVAKDTIHVLMLRHIKKEKSGISKL
jgi:hypothetical protein